MLHNSVLLKVPNSSDQSSYSLGWPNSRHPALPGRDSNPLAKGWVVGDKPVTALLVAAVAQSARLVDLGSDPRDEPNHGMAERALCPRAHASSHGHLKRGWFSPRDSTCSCANITFKQPEREYVVCQHLLVMLSLDVAISCTSAITAWWRHKWQLAVFFSLYEFWKYEKSINTVLLVVKFYIEFRVGQKIWPLKHEKNKKVTSYIVLGGPPRGVTSFSYFSHVPEEYRKLSFMARPACIFRTFTLHSLIHNRWTIMFAIFWRLSAHWRFRRPILIRSF